MEDDKDRRPAFEVKDRRRFTETGEARPDAAQAGPGAAPSRAEAQGSPAEEVTFSSFVLGLSTQALLHLGEIPDPGSGAVARDLVAARQVIDILGILRDKTRNNLAQGEESLLDSILYDLRIRYVELVRSGTKEGA
jgi:uncharacterized protein DUF1844